MGQEIAARATCGRTACAALSRKFLSRASLPVASRVGVATACAHASADVAPRPGWGSAADTHVLTQADGGGEEQVQRVRQEGQG